MQPRFEPPLLKKGNLFWVHDCEPDWPEALAESAGSGQDSTQKRMTEFLKQLSLGTTTLETDFLDPPKQVPYKVKLFDFSSKLQEDFDFQTWLDPFGYKRPSLGTRKPDHPGYGASKGELSMQVIVELKGVYKGEFTDMDKGHVLDFGMELLTLQTNRSFVYMCLTDTVRFLFFRLSKETEASGGTTYRLQESPVFLRLEGWNRLFGLLAMDLEALGHVTPMIPGYNLTRVLGEGGFSVAYEGELVNNTKRKHVIKVFRQANRRDLEKEVLEAVREKLSEDHANLVPEIVHAEETASGAANANRFCLIESLVGTPLSKLGSFIDTLSLADLVFPLKAAHEAGYYHCDVKPSNLIQGQQGQFRHDD